MASEQDGSPTFHKLTNDKNAEYLSDDLKCDVEMEETMQFDTSESEQWLSIEILRENEVKVEPKKKRTTEKHPELWKQNVRKSLYQNGLPFVDRNGIERPGKSVGPACGRTCRHSCSVKISNKKRQEIHEYFWSLNTQKKHAFYEKYIQKFEMKRRRTECNEKPNPRKKNSFRYYLKPDAEIIQVCRYYFINTLGISDTTILYFFAKSCKKVSDGTVLKPEDRRGKNRALSQRRLQEILDHIGSFATVDSKYCKSLKRHKYMDSNLNVTILHSLYTMEVDDPVRIDTYRNLFNKHFNYSFKDPKKYFCHKCNDESQKIKKSANVAKHKKNHRHGKESTLLEQELLDCETSALAPSSEKFSNEPDEIVVSVESVDHNIKEVTTFSEQAENSVVAEDVNNFESFVICDDVESSLQTEEIEYLEHIDSNFSNNSEEKNSLNGSMTEFGTTEFSYEYLHADVTDQLSSDSEKNIAMVTNKRKKNSMDSQFVDRSDNEGPEKDVGSDCELSCSYACTEKISTEKRQEIHTQFWSLTPSRKRAFYGNFIKRDETKRSGSKLNKRSNSKTKNSFRYYLKPDDQLIQVCSNYFRNTLAITDDTILNFFEKYYGKDSAQLSRRPKNCDKKKSLSEKQEQDILKHIERFPTVESHYCKSSACFQKKLDSSLSVAKMYNLYKTEVDSPVSIDLYRQMFNTRFNYCFNTPKKDECGKCSVFKANIGENAASEIELQEKHIIKKEYAEAELFEDVTHIKKGEAVLLFNLQNVFTLPKIFASSFYYKRKLCVYNLTGTLVLPSREVTYCAIWNESNSTSPENDIACALIRILKEITKDFPNIAQFIIWSDSCVQQNRNEIMSTALLQFLHDNPSTEFINQKFGEPGHSYFHPVQVVHNAIEKYLKQVEIPSQVALVRLLQNANLHLRVLEMNTDDFKSYSPKSDKLYFQEIPFQECKALMYNKSDLFQVGRKLSFEDKSYVYMPIKKNVNSFFDIHIFWSQPLSMAPKKKMCSLKITDLRNMLPFFERQEDMAFYQAILQT